MAKSIGMRIFFAAAAVLLMLTASASGSTNVPESAELLVLLYHHIDDAGDDSATVSERTFASQLEKLYRRGFTSVSPEDLIAYVDDGVPLPEKPVWIVFDDGYESVCLRAYPWLHRYQAKATVCVIGVRMGQDHYKDTDHPTIPYFTWEQARVMAQSGLVTFGSHSFDLHMHAAYESGTVREYAARLPDESAEVFAAVFSADHAKMCALMEDQLGHTPLVFAYPHGRWDMTAEEILRASGVRITLTTEYGTSTLRQGDPDSLYLLRRCNVNEFTDFDTILDQYSKKLYKGENEN